jgi:two-component sensor histidine kinase
MNVILQGDGSAFGVLEVDSRSEGEFSEHDLAFLQGAANILGMAIEQQNYQRKLKAALERHQILLQEINHRVKNSLQVVAAMLHLQASASSDPKLREALAEASSRIKTVGGAYERLAYNGDFETIELVAYIRKIFVDLDKEVLPSKLHLDATEKIEFAADRAILVALIINELVLNAARHAYPDRAGETIWVTIAQTEPDFLLVSVRDEGVGLPADFDPRKSKRLGTMLVAALSKQLNAELTRLDSVKGSNFMLRIPKDGLR